MATIGKDPNGCRRILFVGRDGKRQTVRLGKVSDREAERLKDKVEQLAAASRTGNDPPGKLVEWLSEIADGLHARLVKVGLTRPRTTACPSLGEFLDGYKTDRPDVGEGTQTNYGIIGNRLIAFFGRERRLNTIRPGDADRFADHLRGQYAQATAAKTIKMSRQMFRRAVRLKLIAENPFEGIKAGTEQNRGRSFFVTSQAAQKVLDACPDHEWRLQVALARYGGLRTPSEVLSLTWQDVLWDQDRFRVRSPQTVRQGKPERVVPLFTELRPYLEEAYDRADPGTLHVVTRWRDGIKNMRTQLARIIRKAGMVPWPRLFQNLRASRETELAERFPLRVVTDWLGNTPAVAHDHYLSTTEEHYRKAAAEGGTESGTARRGAGPQGFATAD